MELILLIGLPASGKSTFFKSRFADTHVRINLDMLRSRRSEEIIFSACLWAQRDVVVDNTNVKRSERALYISMAKRLGYKKIVGYYFIVAVPGCIDRNILRGRPIPDKAIVIKSQAFEIPELQEGFSELYNVYLESNNDFKTALRDPS